MRTFMHTVKAGPSTALEGFSARDQARPAITFSPTRPPLKVKFGAPERQFATAVGW